jgi:hypothetical protein
LFLKTASRDAEEVIKVSSYISAVGPSAQARDTGCSGKEEHANSNWKRSDYLEKEKMVL